VLVETAIWHGPVGTGERFAAQVERAARAELDRQEMTLVVARLERSPLQRRLVLSGPADDFQQRELVRIMGAIPGVADVRWANPPAVTTEEPR
jgi:acyl dehydratase